jgi:NTE family protein
VIATDLRTGEAVELSQGDLSSAIHASCALPGIFKPVLLDNRYLIDGGITSPLPIEVARKYGAQLIIAIDVSEKLPSTQPSHMFGVAKRGLEITYQKLIAHSLEKADIAIKMSFQDIGMFSEDHNHQMYAEGKKQALSMLPAIQEKLVALNKTS